MRILIRILIPLLVVNAGHSSSLDPQRLARLEEAIEAQTRGLAPGVAVGIVHNGRIIYEKYAGYGNLEDRTNVGPKTRFNLASNGKQFTALCLLELEKEGLIRLDDPIRKYLPDFLPNPEFNITISNLINHSSGVRDVYDLWALQGLTWWKEFFSNKDALRLLEDQQDLNFPPGSQFLYSNSNYILLAEIVNRVTGTSFRNRTDSMFARLGMKETSFRDDAMDVLPNRAHPYGKWNSWKEYPSITSLHGDGALYSTLPDQLRWEQLVQGSLQADLETGLIEKSQGQLIGTSISKYGYGLNLGTHRGLRFVHHEGSTGAYNASVVRFPSENLSVVVMSNHGQISPTAFSRAFAEAALGPEMFTDSRYPSQPATLKTKPKDSEIVGVYRTDGDEIYVIDSRRGRLYCTLGSQASSPLIHLEGNLYRFRNARTRRIAFSPGESSLGELVLYQPSQEPTRAIKLATGPGKAGDKVEIDGRYVNRETNTEIRIRHKAGFEYEFVRNGKSGTGSLLGRDFLRSNGFSIRVTRNEQGRVQGLLVDRARIRNVVFSKDNVVSSKDQERK